MGACVLLMAHSPYRQWDVYRRVRLVIVASFEQQEAVRLGRRLVTALARHIPESRAMFARARDTNDLFRLLASRQLDVALVDADDARDAAGGGGLGGAGIPLRSLAQVGPYLLVCRDDLPRAAAYRIAEALADRWREILEASDGPGGPRPDPSAGVPLHPGAAEYYDDHAARPER